MHVYVTQNEVNGKCYVGQTCRPLDKYLRSDVTRALLKGEDRKPYLYNAIRKYGEAAFSIHLLVEAIDKAQADKLEQFFIRTLGTQDKEIGYNIAAGGGGSFGYTRIVTDEWRERARIASTGRKHSQETKERIRAAHKGRPKSAEHRKSLSTARMGIRLGPFSIEHRKKQSIAAMGHLVSDETRRKISEANKAFQARKREANHGTVAN